MKFGSLFSGIGGMDLGLEWAGMTCIWQVEIDEYCQRVLQKHWPDVPKYGDIYNVGKHNLETPDLICGGFPCQPVSFAGKQKGIEDERWLWPEFYRVVLELRPRYILVENVPGLYHQGFGEIITDLAEGGYDAEWDCIPASAFGAPHKRERVFIVAYSISDLHYREKSRGIGAETQISSVYRTKDDSTRRTGGAGGVRLSNTGYVADAERKQDRRIFESRIQSNLRTEGENVAYPPSKRLEGGIGGTSERSRLASQGQNVADAERKRARSRDVRGNRPLRNAEGEMHGRGRIEADVSGGWWTTEPCLGELVDGLSPELAGRFIRVVKGCPDRVNKLRALGNAVVPQVAEWIGRLIMEYDNEENDK